MLGSIITAGATILGQGMANDANSAASQTAYDRQRLLRQQAYNDSVVSLKSAGLNPMLAYQNGAVPTPQVNTPIHKNIMEGAANSAFQVESLKNIDAQNKLLEAQATKALAEAEAIPTSTANVAQQTENLKATLPKIVEEVQHAKLDTLNKEEQVRIQRHIVTLKQIEQDLMKGQIDNIQAQTRTQNVLTDLRKLEIPGAKNIAQWEESLGQYSKEAGAAGTAAKALGALTNSARKVLGK